MATLEEQARQITSQFGQTPDLSQWHPLLRESVRGAYSQARLKPLNIINQSIQQKQQAVETKQKAAASGAEEERRRKLQAISEAFGLGMPAETYQTMKEMGLMPQYQKIQQVKVQQTLDDLKTQSVTQLYRQGLTRDKALPFVQGAMDIDDAIINGIPKDSIYKQLETSFKKDKKLKKLPAGIRENLRQYVEKAYNTYNKGSYGTTY